MSESLLFRSVLTTSGTGAPVDVGVSRNRVVPVDVKISAASGTTPSLVVQLETSVDGITWSDLGDPTASLSSVATTRILPPKSSRYLRAAWTIAGTSPSLTTTITAYAIDSYCDVQKFQSIGLPADAIRDIPTDVLAEALRAASALADTYLDSYYDLPLLSWTADLERAVASIAAYDVMSFRGYSPTAGDNNNFRDRYLDAIKWLQWVSQHGSTGIVGSPEDEAAPEGGSAAIASMPRRWRR